MKTYSPVGHEVDRIIDRVREQYHAPDLDGVTVTALFVYDMEGSEPVLKLAGYPAQAVVNITPLKQRALGVSDAVIVIDRSNWLRLTAKQRDALIDHELYHLDRVVDKSTEIPQVDAVDRPKLKIRRHDHQVGMFSEILRRHGSASAEQRMVQAIFDDAGQAYWNFEVPPVLPAAKPLPSRKTDSDRDEMFDRAVLTVIADHAAGASISALQRTLKIGYNRAARMLEQMEAGGILGPMQANGKRAVLPTAEVGVAH